MEKAVVFGGSGFLGSHVADALSRQGYEVVVYDIAPSRYIQENQQMVVGDLLDSCKVKDVLKGAKYAFHFAGIADIGESSTDPYLTMQVNVMGTCNILEACKVNNVKKIVFASTIYVYSKMGSFYRVSKQSAEKLIEEYYAEYGLNFTILRFGSLYGPRANHFNTIRKMIMQAINEKKITRVGNGEEIRDYIYVLDAASSCVRVLSDRYDNRHVVINGSQTMKVKELMLMIQEIFDDRIAIEFLKGELKGHYFVTPHTYKPEVALKLVPEEFHDLGQGLLEVIYDVEKDLV